MSALPAAVRKQIKQANDLVKELYKDGKYVGPQGGGETPPGETAAPPTGETPPAGTPPNPPAGEAPPPNGETPPAAAAPPPVAPPAPDTWEQKYKVLQGKYNAEVPRLQGQLRDLSNELTGVRTLLASLAPQPGSAPAGAPAPSATPPTKLVKDEEVREFGPDLIDVMRRVSREEQAALLPEIDKRVQPVSQRVGQVEQTAQSVAQRAARNDTQNVISLLAAEIPNWAQVNEDENFLAWLDQVDPFAGVQRGMMLKQAFQAHDGPRVVAFFRGFLKENAVVQPPAAQPNAAAPGTPPAASQRTLEQLVAPGTPKIGASTAARDGSGKRVWTRAEIGQFYEAVRTNKFNGTPAERKAAEADIFAAQREGRVR